MSLLSLLQGSGGRSRIPRTILRRIGGTVAALAILGAAYLLFNVVGAPPSGSYEVTAVLGEAGRGLQQGNDVKVRGVLVGSVKEVRLDDEARAEITMTIWPDYRLPADVDVVVTTKTFLGEKQVELRPQGALEEGPALEAGARLEVDPEREPTEVQDFLAALDPVLDVVDPADLGKVVDAFGTFTQTDAEMAGRNLELGAELADFGAQTAEAQVDRLSRLANVTSELATTAEDFNRLNRSLPTWTSILPDRQADVRQNLETLSDFSTTFGEFLTAEEQAIGRLLDVSTQVGAVLAGQSDDLAEMIHGIYRYAFKLGRHGGSLNDGSEYGWFRVFIGDEGTIGQICASLPDELEAEAPGCAPGSGSPDQGPGSDDGESGPLPTPLPSEPPSPPGGGR